MIFYGESVLEIFTSFGLDKYVLTFPIHIIMVKLAATAASGHCCHLSLRGRQRRQLAPPPLPSCPHPQRE